ncbi:MAG: (2E,6E)-farnesyl diphosphate synthase [Gammaproteobacteria bacterium]|nr:(2E,6E)-farnesyl diphosphate synthase [Gammaproteobacteria bacterium]MCP5298699.1 (2E,6E)-farnesyl diphosphate synthase [Chromatiaceae bacterium]
MTLDPGFQVFLGDCRVRVERALDHWLPTAATTPTRLHEAMRYATLGDGKRVRPTLVYASGHALGMRPECLDAAACAVELIHAYSLVHDDLPAMDDDALRRGRPTCHKAFDEATAILAGDALQTLAFKVLCEDDQMCVDRADRLRMIDELAHAAGSRGMAGGQALDMQATGSEIDLAQLESLHIHKTGALILASVRLGALAAGAAAEPRLASLERYAKCIGLAFQVHDDVLDVEGETAVLGKTRGKDAATHKATYPGLIGLDAARDMARNLIDEALENLAAFDEKADPLRQLARYVVGRKR